MSITALVGRRLASRVQRHDNRTELGDGEPRGGEVEAVGEHHRDRIAFSDATIGQYVGESRGAFVQLRERKARLQLVSPPAPNT